MFEIISFRSRETSNIQYGGVKTRSGKSYNTTYTRKTKPHPNPNQSQLNDSRIKMHIVFVLVVLATLAISYFQLPKDQSTQNALLNILPINNNSSTTLNDTILSTILGNEKSDLDKNITSAEINTIFKQAHKNVCQMPIYVEASIQWTELCNQFQSQPINQVFHVKPIYFTASQKKKLSLQIKQWIFFNT